MRKQFHQSIRHTRLLVALLLLTLLLGTVAGCSPAAEPQTTDTPDDSQTPTTQPSVETPPADETTDSPADDGETEAEPAYFPRPTTETLSAWALDPNQFLNGDWNNCPGYIALSELTNVEIDWTTAAYPVASEQFNIMIVSQELPDIIHSFTGFYTRGIDDAIDQEIILEVSDIIDQYMPTYKALVEQNDLHKKTTTDGGHVGALYCIYSEKQMPWSGLNVRVDWLEQLGMDIPRTYDEMYEALVGFRDVIGAEVPMMFGSMGDSSMGNGLLGYAFSGGFGAPNAMLQKDGVVSYGPMTEGFLDYLTTFRQWYSEGLIDRDFPSRMDSADAEYTYGSKTGIWFGQGMGTYDTLEGITEDVNYHAIPIQNPVVSRDQGTSHFCVNSDIMGSGSAISATCENVELAARWMDYCYGDGAIALNFGIEGETYFFDENNQPVMDAEGIVAYFGGENLYSQLRQCTGPIETAYYRYMYRATPIRNSTINLPDINYDAAWQYDDNDWAIPTGVTMTADESYEYNAKFFDIQQTVTEYTIRIIIGDYELSAYEELMEKIDAMGIEECIKIMQTAVDRYFAR